MCNLHRCQQHQMIRRRRQFSPTQTSLRDIVAEIHATDEIRVSPAANGGPWH